MSASAPRAAPEVANTEDGAGGWPEEQRGSVMGHGSIALFVCVFHLHSNLWKSYHLLLPMGRWRCRQVKGFVPRSHNYQ